MTPTRSDSSFTRPPYLRLHPSRVFLVFQFHLFFHNGLFSAIVFLVLPDTADGE